MLREAQAVVSVNTGIMHVAAVLGASVIGLHGPTSARRWDPLGPASTALVSDCPGCGYLNLGFEYPRHPPPCMEQLPVAKVLAALEEVLPG